MQSRSFAVEAVRSAGRLVRRNGGIDHSEEIFLALDSRSRVRAPALRTPSCKSALREIFLHRWNRLGGDGVCISEGVRYAPSAPLSISRRSDDFCPLHRGIFVCSSRTASRNALQRSSVSHRTSTFNCQQFGQGNVSDRVARLCSGNCGMARDFCNRLRRQAQTGVCAEWRLSKELGIIRRRLLPTARGRKP
jgi:hypothetical protein